MGAAIDRAGHPQLGQDAGTLAGVGEVGVPFCAEVDPAAKLDAVIDFSLPAGALALVKVCRERGIPLVVGTTGFEPEQAPRRESATDRIPVLISANFSKAVNLLMKLAGDAARVLGSAADVEIVERHHHFKKDAPSGTALRLAEVVGREIGVGPEAYAHGRHGVVGDRPRAQIGLHALRTGDNPGEHTVVFGLMGECLELSHRALNRDGFAAARSTPPSSSPASRRSCIRWRICWDNRERLTSGDQAHDCPATSRRSPRDAVQAIYPAHG